MAAQSNRNDDGNPENARDKLNSLHTAIAEELLQRVRSGNALAAELSVATKFLKDNHVECVATEDNPLGQLADSIPDFDNEEWNEQVTGHG